MSKIRQGPTSAAVEDVVQKPQDWEMVISVAYLRLTGSTQEQAALGAGCGERTIREWETCSWWPEAEAEANRRWLRGMDARARDAINRAFGDPDQYAQTARWWGERRIAELAPPKQRTEHSGKVGLVDARELTDQQLAKIAVTALPEGEPEA